MKKITWFVLIAVILTASVSFAFWGGKKYYVIFEKVPNIIDNKVFSMTFPIGEVTDKELGNNNTVIITIKIDKKYAELIKANGIFVVDDGRLIYESVGDDSNVPLPSKSKILGFVSKADFLWFKTKSNIKKFSHLSKIKIEELIKKFGESI